MAVRLNCPSCGGEATRTTLRTRPRVFICDACSEMFTGNSHPAPVPTLRRIRRQILQRWDQLADDVYHLVQEIRDAPDGTFTDAERDNAVFELDNTVWNVMVNDRPRLPSSKRLRAKVETADLLRRSREMREFVAELRIREEREKLAEEKAAHPATSAPAEVA